MGNQYKTHSFKKDWHEKIVEFIEENDDLNFDSPKYFIKFCVNKYMDEYNSRDELSDDQLDAIKQLAEDLMPEE